MRIVVVAVVIALCWGCAGPDQFGTRTDSVERTEREASAAARKETIRELVEKSEIIVLGNITGIRDGTARDAGVGYDVVLETVLCGSDVPRDVLRFRSEGRVGCAKYRMDERVLLFLTRCQEEFIQVKPVCYIAEAPAAADLDLRPVQNYLDFIKSEIRSQKDKM